MQGIFDRYRKEIITGGGVIIFLLAGLLTMLLTDSGKNTFKNVPASQESITSRTGQPSQNQNHQNQTALPETETLNNELPSSESRQAVKDLYVYVTGEIKRPGVYKLSEDARIFQLIDLAGGFTSKADTEAINLAEFLYDGVHVHVGAKLPPKVQRQSAARIPGLPESIKAVQPVIQPQLSAPQESPQKSSGSETKVDVNHADAKELESLNGVGPAIAKRIVEYRKAHGNFAKAEDLIKVKGIGPAKLEKMKSQILIR